MTCNEVRLSAAEFVLGLLDGAARAAMVDHLEQCVTCRIEIDDLSADADLVVAALAPPRRPPAGFDVRVMEALAALGSPPHEPHSALGPEPVGHDQFPARPAPRRRHRAPRPRRDVRTPTSPSRPVVPAPIRGVRAVVSLLAAVLVVAGIYVAARRDDAHLREFALRTPQGETVGELYLHGGSAPWMLVSADDWIGRWGSGEFVVRLHLTDGRTIDAAEGVQTPAGPQWGTRVNLPATPARAVAIVGVDGRLWCSALLS